MHTNSKLIFDKYAKQYFCPGMKVLEIGPDGSPSTYQKMVGDDSITWHTLDIYDNPQLTYPSSPEYAFAIPDNTYDIVFSAQVIEHVRKIWVWMREVSRVCKVGGTVITINPVSWPYHEFPVDCWRAFPDGMRALYEDSSLEVIRSEWESLEAAKFRRTLPGRSREWQGTGAKLLYSMLGKLGMPVECAYDTITIGKKVAQVPAAPVAQVP